MFSWLKSFLVGGWILFWAFFWSFNEAIWFFVVPDVLLTCIALFSLCKALFAVGWATIGATLGGGVMYFLG
jgi:membrane protein YqaA with SNARE-associated domain